MKITTLTLLAGLFCSTVALATPPMMMGPGHQDRMMMMSQMLRLTPEQQSAMQALMNDDPSQDRMNMHQKHRELMQQLLELDSTAADYQSKVDAIAEQKSSMAAAKAKANIQTRAKFLQILTPEQKAQLKGMMGNHQRHGMMGMNHEQCPQQQGNKCPHHRMQMQQQSMPQMPMQPPEMPTQPDTSMPAQPQTEAQTTPGA